MTFSGASCGPMRCSRGSLWGLAGEAASRRRPQTRSHVVVGSDSICLKLLLCQARICRRVANLPSQHSTIPTMEATGASCDKLRMNANEDNEAKSNALSWTFNMQSDIVVHCVCSFAIVCECVSNRRRNCPVSFIIIMTSDERMRTLENGLSSKRKERN